MPLSTFAFTPAQGFRDSSFAPTDPPSEAALRDTMQDIPDQLRDALNVLITTLNSTTDGASGADNVAATPISGVAGDSVQEILESLYMLTQTLLPFPDGSVTNAKLATDVKVGSLASLLTAVKSSVVGAINELFNNKLDKTGKAADSELLDGTNSTGYCRDNPTTTIISTGFASGWSGIITSIKNHNNLVELNLNLIKTTDITFDVVYTLPPEIRPTLASNGALYGLGSGGALVLGSVLDVNVNIDGVVTVFNLTPTATGTRKVFAYKIMYYTA